MPSPSAGPGEQRPTVVDQITDVGGGLFRVHLIDPSGAAHWVQIPEGKTTLEFVVVTAAAFNYLLVRGMVRS